MNQFAHVRIFILFVLLCLLPVFSVLANHTVLLKKGKTIKGTVTGQNLDHVEVTVIDGKHLVIPKKSILKIIYHDLNEDEEAKIRKAEEDKREAEKLKLIEAKNQELAKKQEENKTESAKIMTGGPNTSGPTSLRTSFLLGSPNVEQSITLANLNQKCEPFSEYPEYFWFFGAFRFKEPKLVDLLPKDGKPVRISQSSTYKDIAFTLLGGFLITVTRKTLIVEVCEGQGYRLISEKELSDLKESAVHELKTKHEIETIQDDVERELLEKDLEAMEKAKKKK